MARIIPLSGTDARRQAVAAAGGIRANEIHTTTQRRIFMDNTLVGGVVWHGEVADAAARLALNTTSSRGCFPGDFCRQADVDDVTWTCVSNRGADEADWIATGGGGAGGSAEWGGIGGTLADQDDLVEALAGKADTEHTHSLSDIAQSGASEGQTPVWNGSAWVPQTPSAGGGSSIKNNLEVWLDCNTDNTPVDLHAGRSCAWVGTPAGATGKIGRAFSFNGTNQVNVLNYPTLQKKARSGWTCCAWIKASAGDCYWAGANGNPALYARSWYAYINSGGATCQYAFSNDGWNWPHSVNAPCALNQWVFLALVCDPLNLSWIGYGHNGLAVRATLTSTPNENALALANNLYCGVAQGSAALLVDGFAYWRRPLRSEELAYLYNDGAGRAYAAL